MSGIRRTVRKKTTKEIFETNRSRTPPPLMSGLVLWLHNIRSLHNVGSAFRTADAFGIRSLFLSGYTPYPPRPEITKTALGAEENVRWEHSADPGVPLEWCRRNGYTLAGLEQTDHSTLLPEYRDGGRDKLCLLFGNEVTGIEPDLLEKCDVLLEIPQYGEKHSFNISVSVGITLYHFLSTHLP
ncbi:TrmH family RNA methyltransferase [Balneolales bacterium ANBcel1]|nr:TrmH family RNA methyltransferase [Balneolales bacterium ANBcel1]